MASALLADFLPEAQRNPSFWAKPSCKECHGSGWIRYHKRMETTISAEHGVQRKHLENQSAPCGCAAKRFAQARKDGKVLPLKFHWHEVCG